MTNLLLSLLALALLSGALPLTAQEENPLPPPPPADAALEETLPPPEFPPPFLAPDIREFLDHLKAENPQEFQRLEELRLKDRKAFREELARILPRKHGEILDRQQLELDRQCWLLAQKIRASQDPQETAQLQEQLKKKVEEMLDLLVNQTRKRLEELDQRIRAIEEKRTEILEKKIDFYLHAPIPPFLNQEEHQPRPGKRDGEPPRPGKRDGEPPRPGKRDGEPPRRPPQPPRPAPQQP
ncbi:MAG: hypothetical protein ACI4SG_00425 [Oligosphaeraceae bacterium]